MRLVAYHGFVDNKRVVISGRLVFGNLRKPKSDDSIFQNTLDMIKTYFAIGAPKRKIEVSFNNHTKTVRTNKKGFFKTYFDSDKEGIKSYSVKYKDNLRKNKVFLPNKTKSLAIITDVDDTFLVTYSASFFKRIWTTISKNFLTRNPVKDIIDIYKEFSGPVFYVSDSQWRLYDILDGFRKIHKLPQGPFLLKGKSKYYRIKSVLKSYPYDVVLIGDDSHKDPEEYLRVQKEFPKRIKAICIRNISSKKRFEKVNKMLSKTNGFISSNEKECVDFVKKNLKV
jgi:phosphatidate phosphatase APP1